MTRDTVTTSRSPTGTAEEVGAAFGGAREDWEDEVVVLSEGTRGEPLS
jgi:hypothetical protein